MPTPRNTPQPIAGPAPNALPVHHITQLHVQFSQLVHAPQTGRHGAAETIAVEFPDATARGTAVVVVWHTAMIHARRRIIHTCETKCVAGAREINTFVRVWVEMVCAGAMCVRVTGVRVCERF